MDAAEFVIRIIDKATAPAKRISAAMAGVEKALKPVKNNAAFKALDKAGDKLWDFGKAAVVAGGALAVGLSVALTNAAVDAAMFTQNTSLAFTQLTHSAAGGAQAFAEVKGIVADLGVDLHQTSAAFTSLLAAQFSIKESSELVKMSADLSAIGIHGEEAGRILMAISQIKTAGTLKGQDLMQLAQAGISLQLVYGQIGKAIGKTAQEAMVLQQNGKISSQVGIDAIQAAVKEKLGIANFGEARKKFVNENLSGMIESLKAAGDLLFLKLGDSVMGAAKAMGPLVKDTMKWVQTLDTSSVTAVVTSVLDTLRALIPVGREFITGFLSGFGQLADGLRLNIDASTLVKAADAGRAVANAMGLIIRGATMAANALSFFTTPVGNVVLGLGLAAIVAVKVIGAVSAVAGAFTAIAPIFTFLAGAIPTVVGVLLTLASTVVLAVGAVPLAIAAALVAVGAAIFAWWDEINAFFGGIPGQMLQFGTDMVMGLVNGITGSVGAAWTAVKNLGNTVIDATKSTLGIASPSKEFEKLGAFSAEGFAKGIEGGAPTLQSASSRALAAPALGGAGTILDGGGRGGAPTISLQVSVDGRGKDDQALASTIADVAVERLVSAFEALTNPSPSPTPA